MTLESSKRWREKNREKVRASQRADPKRKLRQKSRRLIEIPFGQKCQLCNKKYAFERHHEDYSNALKVLFVCIPCHRAITKRLNNSE